MWSGCGARSSGWAGGKDKGSGKANKGSVRRIRASRDRDGRDRVRSQGRGSKDKVSRDKGKGSKVGRLKVVGVVRVNSKVKGRMHKVVDNAVVRAVRGMGMWGVT